jgi:epoxyqueuosine reductase
MITTPSSLHTPDEAPPSKRQSSAAAPSHARRAATARVLAHARSLGFDLVGVAPADDMPAAERVFKERRDRGLLAGWRFSDADVETRCRPQRLLPGARAIVCTATSYFADVEPHDPQAPRLRGAVSNYAWGLDYHRVLRPRLAALARFIETEFPGATCRVCLDTDPLLDRAVAVRAGIGWIGKSGNLLTREFGSYVFLGAVVTTLALEPSRPLRAGCGGCRECVPRCPTGAIGPHGEVDARRCISDLTQSKRPIPLELRKAMGNRLWGCDTCQTVCPVNDRKAAARHPEFAPLPYIGTAMDLPSILLMTKKQFRAWFGPTAMAWRGKAVLQRNAAVALGNSRDARAVAPLIAALRDRKALVRGHASWALGELGGEQARRALHELLTHEADPWVRDEAEQALARSAGERLCGADVPSAVRADAPAPACAGTDTRA